MPNGRGICSLYFGYVYVILYYLRERPLLTNIIHWANLYSNGLGFHGSYGQKIRQRLTFVRYSATARPMTDLQSGCALAKIAETCKSDRPPKSDHPVYFMFYLTVASLADGPSQITANGLQSTIGPLPEPPLFRSSHLESKPVVPRHATKQTRKGHICNMDMTHNVRESHMEKT